ncbi:YncE family protein [Corynebacterium cystitidis]|uniref:YncE family protein n=1 Tax=Corynebacterium cystitidis TaxID=35757 RepID=UPI00211EFA67|nr:YncE family protein [Corynebacterium cystitidis]
MYVTRSVGRPPIKESTLYKLDADTLEIQAEATPEETDYGRGGLWAVYGVGLDDERGLVWITNTRQNTIAVYDADTLELKKQWPADAVHHSRDVIVDQKTGKAYVSSPRCGSGLITVFDGNDLEAEPEKIIIDDFIDTMSLDMNQDTGDLYTVSLVEAKVAKIETRNGNKVTVWDNFDDDQIVRGSGIAYEAKRNRLHVSSQGSANNLVIDATTGKVVKDIPTGAGALNSECSPQDDVVYVTNFGGDTITVIDAETLEIIANLDGGGARVDHVSLGKDGAVYVVNKADVTNEEGESGYNQITKLSLADGAPAPEPGDKDKPGDKGKPGDKDKPGSSNDQASSKPVIAVGAIAAIVAATAGIIGFLLRAGVIPKQFIPQPIIELLNL